MRQIAGAIQEGAKAYLNRQILTIGAIAIVIFMLLALLRDSSDGHQDFCWEQSARFLPVTLECELRWWRMFALPKEPL